MRRSLLTRRRCLALAAAAAAAQVLPAVGQALKRPWPAGRPTPAVALPAFEGPPWSLADAKGQVVLLNFWASWCVPCRSEMPSLELLAQRYEKDGLQVQAVNFRETDAALRRFVQSLPTTLPLLRDADGGVARAFDVRIYPTTVAIGRDGRARFSVIGELDWTGSDARQWVAALL